MLVYILSQIAALLFAGTLAMHDYPSIKHFEYYGVSNKDMAIFHRYASWSKFFFCILAALVFAPNWLNMFFGGFTSFLIIWWAFDPALNLARGLRLFYLGSNDKDGRSWQKLFGNNAGKVKFFLLLLLIVITNLINHLI